MGTTKVRAALPKAVIALVMAFASVAGLFSMYKPEPVVQVRRSEDRNYPEQ